ncbi:MAG TPA: SDR family oxidoreductase [Dehalococcoidia bacterium]|nr:SDR family oxidoreductase [Dehalococcoidia bacterium]
MKLEGKVALVTGASPNIMGGIIEAFAEEGARVVCVDVRPEFANGAVAAVKAKGSEGLAAVCDVTQEEQVKATIEQARETFGGIDILVNGAVIQIRKGVLQMQTDEWRRQVDIILTGTFLFTKHVAQQMVDQGRQGTIINIISTEAHQGNPGNIGYGTCKSGLINFTRAVAMELCQYGIRVNSLTPTATDPREAIERAKRWGLEKYEPVGYQRMMENLERMSSRIPLGKMPSPSDYGRAAVFLASSDAAMMTGFDLRVDAGNVAKYWGFNPAEGITASFPVEQT